jgi:hypothetical protein
MTKRLFDLDDLKDMSNRLEKMTTYYDDGDTWMSDYMAVALRVLFHNTKNSTSLVAHCYPDGKHENLMFYSSSTQYNPGYFSNFSNVNATGKKMSIRDNHYGLLQKEYVGDKFIYKPRCDTSIRIENKLLKYEQWWENETVMQIMSGKCPIRFSRKKLILGVANKDGGAHFDPECDHDYFKFKSKDIIGLVIDGEEVTSENMPIQPSIKQIAHEAVLSIKEWTHA